jgi:hypothetical protein
MALEIIGTGQTYTDPQLWENAFAATLTEDEEAQCLGEEFAVAVTISGHDTLTNNKRIKLTARLGNEHNGRLHRITGKGNARILVTSTSNVINVLDENVEISWLELNYEPAAVTSHGECLTASGVAAGGIQIWHHNIATANNLSTTNAQYGIAPNDTDNVFFVYRNVVMGTWDRNIYFLVSAANSKCLNNTCIFSDRTDVARGIEASTSANQPDIFNNVSFNHAGGDIQGIGNAVWNYNADEDGTETEGANTLNSLTPSNELEYVPDTRTEITLNGDFASDTGWTKGTGWTINEVYDPSTDPSAGKGVAHSDGTQTPSISNLIASPTPALLVKEKWYLMEFTVSNLTADRVRMSVDNSKGGTWRTANGTYRELMQITGGPLLYIQADDNFVGDVDNISVKESVVALDANLPPRSNLINAGTNLSSLIEDKYGPELITNGSMKDNSEWVDSGTPTTNEQYDGDADADGIGGAFSGQYCWKFTTDETLEGMQISTKANRTAGKLYHLKFYVYPVDVTKVGYLLRNGAGSGTLINIGHTVVANTWQLVERIILETGTGTNGDVRVISPSAQAAGTWYVDEVSLTEYNPALPELDVPINNRNARINRVTWSIGAFDVVPTYTDTQETGPFQITTVDRGIRSDGAQNLYAAIDYGEAFESSSESIRLGTQVIALAKTKAPRKQRYAIQIIRLATTTPLRLSENSTFWLNERISLVVDNVGRLLFDVADKQVTSTSPASEFILNGMPMALGPDKELILYDSGFNINGIDEYSTTMLGGMPILVGRVDNRWYLLCNPI